jgi:hypothetical protein
VNHFVECKATKIGSGIGGPIKPKKLAYDWIWKLKSNSGSASVVQPAKQISNLWANSLNSKNQVVGHDLPCYNNTLHSPKSKQMLTILFQLVLSF